MRNEIFKKQTATGSRWFNVVESKLIEWDEVTGKHNEVDCVLTSIKTYTRGKHRNARLTPSNKTFDEEVTWANENGYAKFNL